MMTEHTISFSKELVAERPVAIGTLVDAAILQFRDDKVDEVGEMVGLAGALQVEAVEVGVRHPAFELIGDLRWRAHEEAFAPALRAEIGDVLRPLDTTGLAVVKPSITVLMPRLSACAAVSGECFDRSRPDRPEYSANMPSTST